MTDLEAKFLYQWRVLGGPELAQEYRFHHRRKWRFDFAHVPSRIAIEVEGGTWRNGRHNRPAGYRKDAEKYNHATLDGWRVFRFTGSMIDDVPFIEQVIELTEDRKCLD